MTLNILINLYTCRSIYFAIFYNLSYTYFPENTHVHTLKFSHICAPKTHSLIRFKKWFMKWLPLFFRFLCTFSLFCLLYHRLSPSAHWNLAKKRSYRWKKLLSNSFLLFLAKKSYRMWNKISEIFHCTWYIFIILIPFFFSKSFFILFAFFCRRKTNLFICAQILNKYKNFFSHKSFWNIKHEGGWRGLGRREGKASKRVREKLLKWIILEHTVFNTQKLFRPETK